MDFAINLHLYYSYMHPISILFQFICSGANHHGENTDTVKIDENDDPVCCANVDAGNLGTGKLK